MRSVLALALCVLLIASPTMGKVHLMAAAQEAAAAIRLCPPEDPMYLAGQAAAREFALQHCRCELRRAEVTAAPRAGTAAF